MSLASNALISVAELKTFLGVEKELSDIDTARYEYFINIASEYIENYCGRSFITGTTTELFDGDGTAEYYVKNIPITASITTSDIMYRSGTGDTWTAITGEFAQDNAAGRVYFTDGSVFSKGRDNWKIAYSYGYSISDAPADLKLAAAELAGAKKKMFDDKALGVSGITFPEHTISYSFDRVSDFVRGILDKYKRIA